MSSKQYNFGPFLIDAATRQLLREGEPVKLRSQVFDVLLMLVENRERMVERQELLDAIWSDAAVGTNSLDQCVSAIRKALGDDAQDPQYIRTIHRKGFRFVAEAEQVTEVRRHHSEQPGGRRVGPKKRWYLIAAAALAVLLTAAFILISRVRKSSPPPAEARSVAVLPFENLGAAGDDYLILGMADALVERLSEVDGIVVRPTSAVVKYTPGTEPSSAGRDLRVDAVLAGKFHRINDRVRVGVQLVDVRSGSVLWAKDFDEEFTSISTLHDAIHSHIVRTVMPQLTGTVAQRPANRHTAQPRAYEHYMMGRYFSNKWTEDGQHKAIENYRLALEIDPGYAHAYAGLADSYWGLSNLFMPPAEAMPLAKAAASKALELDPNLGEAHLSLGLVLSRYDWNFAEAENEFKKAVTLNDRDAAAHEQYGMFLASTGRFREAEEELNRALALNPVSASIRVSAGVVRYYSREYDQAIKHFLTAVEMEPGLYLGHMYLGFAYKQKGSFYEAETALERSLELSEVPMALGMLGHTFAARGSKVDAKRILNRLEQLSRRRWVSPYYAAIIHIGMGEKREALERLHQAYEERAEDITFLRIDPLVDPVRSEPEFHTLISKL